MTSFLIDSNVSLAMTWNLHPQHARASLRYQSIDDASLWFCRFIMLGFLRLLTNSKVMGGSTVTVSEVLRLYERWTHDPRVELVPKPRGMEKAFYEALIPFALQPATKAIADCYLVGFAEANGAHLVTFDRGLASSAQAHKVPVMLIRPI